MVSLVLRDEITLEKEIHHQNFGSFLQSLLIIVNFANES